MHAYQCTHTLGCTVIAAVIYVCVYTYGSVSASGHDITHSVHVLMRHRSPDAPADKT